jgi:hypothetical protein
MSHFERASRLMPGGVSSPVRAFTGVGGEPVFVRSAAGAYLEGEDGRRYLDYIGAYGPHILGHGHPQVVAAVTAAMPPRPRNRIGTAAPKAAAPRTTAVLTVAGRSSPTISMNPPIRCLVRGAIIARGCLVGNGPERAYPIGMNREAIRFCREGERGTALRVESPHLAGFPLRRTLRTDPPR